MLQSKLEVSPYGWAYCEICGNVFTKKTENNKICSLACRNESKRRRSNERYKNRTYFKPKSAKQKAIEKYGYCTGGSLEKCLNCVYPDCVYSGQDTSDISYISHETKDFSVKVAKDK